MYAVLDRKPIPDLLTVLASGFLPFLRPSVLVHEDGGAVCEVGERAVTEVLITGLHPRDKHGRRKCLNPRVTLVVGQLLREGRLLEQTKRYIPSH